MPHTILIVDDNSTVRAWLRSWIESTPDFHLCGEAENGEVAIAKVKEMHPDIVILDLHMPVMNGLDAARHISQLAPHTAIVMFTLHPSGELLRAARAVGVKDVVSKTDQLSDSLLIALRQICP